MNFFINKINRRILNIALGIVNRHVKKQNNLFIYTYKRNTDELTPLSYKARGITVPNEIEIQATNNWGDIDSIINYSDKIVIDIGASLGATSVPFARKAKMVYALEPQIDNYGFLLDQIKIRQIRNIVTFNIAASDYDGSAKFFNRESHGIHSLGTHNKGKVLSSSTVTVTTLDNFWKNEVKEQIALLKIDVEGFEVDVLRGATYLLENKIIEAIIFEFSPRIHSLRNIEIDAPIKLLLDYNYELFTTDGNKYNFDNNNIPKICDLIALPR